MILTLLSCENPWNIWELNYGPQICGANKLTGKMALVLRLHEWTSLFSHGTFQHYVFMLSTRFVQTSGINFNCLTKHEATLSTLDISRRNYCSGYDERAWHGCRYICRDIASRLCSQCIMDKISMSTPSRWRGNVVVYKCCFLENEPLSCLEWLSEPRTTTEEQQIVKIGYFTRACYTILFSKCWKLKNRSLKSIVITFCKKRPSCDRVIKRGLGNLSLH